MGAFCILRISIRNATEMIGNETSITDDIFPFRQ